MCYIIGTLFHVIIIILNAVLCVSYYEDNKNTIHFYEIPFVVFRLVTAASTLFCFGIIFLQMNYEWHGVKLLLYELYY